MEEEGFLMCEEEAVITIAYLPPLPALQTHPALDMVSVPSMTQEEYELNIMSLGPNNNFPDDESITVVCPGEVDGDVVRKFTVKRSSLQRSEALNQFFESRSYRFGCGMTLHFTQVPGACFAVVIDYLNQGSDRYTKAHMTSEVTKQYSDEGKRLEIYTRLHKCARQLELGGLKEMAWAAIKEEESSLSVEYCVTLASLIFANQAGFDQELKKWLMGYIKKHFKLLTSDPVVSENPDMTWSDVVSTLSPGFKMEWDGLLKEQKSRLSMVEEEEVTAQEQEKVFARVLESLEKADVDRVERAEQSAEEEKHGSLKKRVVSTQLTEIDTDKDETEDWEDLDHFCPGPDTSRAADDTKAREWLGAPVNPRFSVSSEPGPRSSSLDLETAKARAVMGINSPSRGTIAGRRKQPTLTRAAKSFSSFLRSPSST